MWVLSPHGIKKGFVGVLFSFILRIFKFSNLMSNENLNMKLCNQTLFMN